MFNEKRITVFTPTYNRAYILNRLYESLKKQSSKSFLWLIIDDGSTDNTEELVNAWIRENIIEIRYYKQENGGKQRAHNKAVELCDTELFICVDSDDYLTENAIEEFIKIWDSIENKQGISGIVALRGKDKNTPIGTRMPKGVRISPLCDLYDRYSFRGDTALLFRTDILKNYKFYVPEGEKFIGEGYIYLQIDQKYSLYVLDKILYITEYLKDGYTKNIRKIIKDNPKGYMLLNRQKVIFSKNIKRRYLSTVRYLIGCFLCKEQHPIKNAPDKWIAIFAYPLAYIYYILTYR